MSTTMESRQCTPSVIARLMGLDELSPPQPVQKKQKVLSENYMRRVASIGVRGKQSSHECHSFRLSDAEHKEFKDTFEIHGKAKRKDCNLRVGKGKSELSLSTVGEVRNAEVVADSKIDLFVKYLQEQEPVITKRPCDWQGTPLHLQSGFLTVLKSSNASDAGKTDICSIFGRETYQESAKLLWKLETGLITDSFGEHVPGNGYKFLRSQKQSVNLPTKVDILKPKLGKKESGTICFPSSNFYNDSHSIDKKHNEFLGPKRGNLCVEEEKRNYLAKDVEPFRSRFRISREISRQTGPGKNNLFAKVSKTGSRDNYSFAEDSELKTFSSPYSCDWKNHSDESSYVAREARKEILERWKTTKKFQEVEVASRNRTLGEMLAIPDQESIPPNSDFRIHEHGQSSQTGLHRNLFMRAPAKQLQHSFKKQMHNQKDGSEYRNSGSSCMESQSVPCLELRNSHSVQDDCVLQGELKRKLEEKDTCEQPYMVFKLSTSCYSCPYSSIQEGRGVQEEQQWEKKFEEKDLSERSTVVAKSSVNCVAADSMAADITTDAETGVEGQSSENHKELHMKMTNCMLLMEDVFSSQVLDASTPQDMPIEIFKEDSVSSFGSYTDPDSLVNLEEDYQPSPNSVLELLFDKGISSSFGYCQVVHSNLHGLQLQLELLKSQSSEAYSEGDGMIVSGGDDSEEGSVGHSEENEEVMRKFSVEESRDFSYMVDVLTEAGFHGRNSGLSGEKRHSPDPTVFEMLEKKYSGQMSWKRSERRLLFDYINSELIEILKPSIGVHGTKRLSTNLLFGRNPEMFEEELWMLLVHQQKQAKKNSSPKVLGKDDKWLELGDDVEVIVREIENSLIDQLAEEVVNLESF